MSRKAMMTFLAALLAAPLGAQAGPVGEPQGDRHMTTLLTGMAQAATDTPSRDEIPERYKWRLTDLFEDEAAWLEEYQEVELAIPSLEAFEGRLCESTDTLLSALDQVDCLSQRFRRLFAYAFLNRDLDTRDNDARALVERMRSLGIRFSQATSWMEPEILSQPAETIEAFLAEPALKVYHHKLHNLLRMRKHVLDKEQEALLAGLGRVLGSPGNIYNTFSDAEFPDPVIETVDGRKVTLTKPNYVRWRAATNREDRRRVFHAFWGAFDSFKNTFAATYSAALDGANFRRNARGYESCLAAALAPDNLPVELYENLIARIHKDLPSFHRYLRLRKELLGVDELRYHDIYAPIIEPARLEFSYEDACRLVIEAVAPLGPQYASVVEYGFSEEGRWVDVYPTTAKRSGAYSAGVYGVHPFVLMNYTGDFNSVTTLAHELGHALHSHLANKTQPYATSGYTIFVAEVASTFNEHLLTHLMLQRAADDRERLFLIGEWMETYRQTVFRQAMFAEFEWRAHQMVEQGKPVTADSLNALYLELLRLYHGHDQGVMNIEELYAVEWAYIPHFYRNFYVFTYVTGLISATALGEIVLEKGEPARKAYLEALAMGGADYPLNILRHAGADLLTPEPYDIANRVFDVRIRMAEEIVARMRQKGEL